MADNEILKDAELDEVVGGSGIETISLMNRLQNAGLASFHTPLVAGNEEAAVAEFKDYLSNFKNPRTGEPAFGYCEIYADGRANDYKVVSVTGQNGEIVAFRHFDADSMFEVIKNFATRG